MIVLHHCHQTRSMRVLWCLAELEVPYQLRVRAFDHALGEAEYLTLNPAGRVPALELDGEVYWESGACLEILTERFPERGLGRPPGDIDRPDYLVWLHFAETLTAHTASLMRQHLSLPPEARSKPVIEIETSRLAQCYAAIEGRLSTPVENRDYLLTSGFSAADIAVGQAVYMARHFVPLAEGSEAARWFARITERPSFAEALPPEGSELVFQRPFYGAGAPLDPGGAGR